MTSAHTTAESTIEPNASRLLAEILVRYGTLDAFLHQLRREPQDDPTVVLPRIVEPGTHLVHR